MIDFLILLLLVALIIGVIALIKGSLNKLRIPNRKVALIVIAASFLLMIIFIGFTTPPEQEIPEENQLEEVGDEEEVEETEEELEEVEEVAPEPEPEPEPETVPDPIVYSGSGDNVIRIEKPEEGPVVLFIRGNQDRRHFAVTGYDENDNYTNLFVNTTDPYEGITMDPSGTTVLLEINGSGFWEIETRSVRSLRVLEDSLEGSGDEVVQVVGDPSTATISGNSEQRHFAVIGYNPNPSLLVNTTDVYDGTVRVSRGTFLLEITAPGNWSVSVD